MNNKTYNMHKINWSQSNLGREQYMAAGG